MPSNQEIEAFSIESSQDSECPSHSLLSAECIKKANVTKAYQAKTENINILQNADKNEKKSSFESGDVDDVLSGESLYKTFTFEQSSEEDVEKCIAFWKSVMQKNLEPIKCSIIESSKTKVPGETESTECLDISEELRKTAKITEEKVHGYYKNLFTTTLKELQKRRLNEVKLIGKSRCKMCESHISATEDLDSDQTEEILGLNNWEPKSKEKNINKLASQKTAGGEGSLKASQKSAKTAVCICEPSEAPQDIESVETIVSDRIHITPNTDRYKLVNLIGEKRRTGAYSRWRKNVTQPCTCEVDTCDCNLNPAIISWKPADETCGCGQLQCQCKIDSGGDGAKEGKAAERTNVEEEMSQQCLCGNINCTCNRKLPELKKSEDTVSLPSLSSSDGSTKGTSSKSKETIIVKLGEAERHHTEDLYKTGPIKKSSKADVTKCDDIYSSRITLVPNKIELNEDECLCTEECNDCMKPSQ